MQPAPSPSPPFPCIVKNLLTNVLLIPQGYVRRKTPANQDFCRDRAVCTGLSDITLRYGSRTKLQKFQELWGGCYVQSAPPAPLCLFLRRTLRPLPSRLNLDVVQIQP